jgi:hypothetical protein
MSASTCSAAARISLAALPTPGEQLGVDSPFGQEAARLIECLLLTELLAWRADGGADTGIRHDVDDGEAVVGAGEIGSVCKRLARGLGAVVCDEHVSHPCRFARSELGGIIKNG